MAHLTSQRVTMEVLILAALAIGCTEAVGASPRIPPDWLREAHKNLSRFQGRMLGDVMALLRRGDIFHWPLGLFDPVISCPPGSQLLRMDPAGPVAQPEQVYDGAKWMCLPLPAPTEPGCMVMSLGSNNQFEFEAAAVALTQCSVHTFDCTVRAAANGSSVNPRRHAFSSLCVGSAEDAAREPDLIDIEGFEFSLMSRWGPDTPALPAFIAMELLLYRVPPLHAAGGAGVGVGAAGAVGAGGTGALRRPSSNAVARHG
eukprot:XP_001695252.1 predicted protein [Chlamydomonas reinhardtii]